MPKVNRIPEKYFLQSTVDLSLFADVQPDRFRHPIEVQDQQIPTSIGISTSIQAENFDHTWNK
ncbi:MAG TPA: hypothetical protein VIH42_11225 [Thermoguttaceae bacterium]